MTYKKVDSLTSLRFVAAALIVVHHSRGVLWLTPDDLSHFALAHGVSFFFVLSGFVLTYVYPRFDKPSSVRQFYLARFARIWPNHLAAFLTLFLPLVLYSVKEGKNILLGTNSILFAPLNLLLVQGWVPIGEVFYSFNWVAWAVSAEVFFYLSFPVLLKDFDTTWRRKVALSALMVIILVVSCNLSHIPGYNGDKLDQVSITGIVNVNPLSRIFEFVLGMYVAFMWRKYAPRIRLNKAVGSILEVFALCIAIATIYYSASPSILNTLMGLIGPAGIIYLIHSGSSLSFAVLIFVMAFEAGLLSQMLQRKILVLLGEASYAMFLFHQLILRFYTHYAQRFSSVPPPLLYAIFWLFLLVISFFVLLFIERPCRKFIINYFREAEI